MTLRILILEDNTTDVELMEHELRHAGFAFCSRRMETREAFLQSLHDWSPDLILADYTLPQFDAMKAIAIVQKEAPLVPVIVVTGTINEETAVECMKAGAVDYVLKDRLLRLGPAIQTAMIAKQIKIDNIVAKKALEDSHANLEQRVQERTAELAETNMQLIQENTARTQTETSLSEAFTLLETHHNNLLSILNQLHIGTVFVDATESITFLNKTAQHLFHQQASTMVGRQWEKVFPLHDSDKTRIRAMLESPDKNRTKISVQLSSPLMGPMPSKVDFDIQDDPSHPQQKIFYVYDTTEIHHLRHLVKNTVQVQDLVGTSQLMQLIYQHIHDLARVDSTVLIEGETGTGKELVARAIHETSHRQGKPFLAINCAGLTDTLVASQLFGHQRGAFTGAFTDQEGLFEAAKGGTVFLDEIGDIPLSVQTSLLRVLEERQITRVGSNTPRPIDVRVLAATHHDLGHKVQEGQFRADLMYRIRVARIRLPSLREHREDIPLLAGTFLSRFRESMQKPIDSLSPDALEVLMKYMWPGNIRELKNAMEFAVIHCQNSVIHPHDFPPEISETLPPQLPSRLGQSKATDKERILEALNQSNGNRRQAAQLLGISKATFYRRLSEFGLTGGGK